MNKKGFTLIELLAVIVILGIIVAIAIPIIGSMRGTVQTKTRENVIKRVEAAASKYAYDTKEIAVYVDTLVLEGYLGADNEEGDILDPTDNSRLNCYLVKMERDGDHYNSEFIDNDYYLDTGCKKIEEIDIKAPVIQVFYLGGNLNPKYVTKSEVEIYAAWEDSDVESYCITESKNTSNCKWEAYNRNILTTTREFEDGNHTRYLFVRDGSGNISKAKLDDIIVDSTEPTVEIEESPKANVYGWIGSQIKYTIKYKVGYSNGKVCYCINEKKDCNPTTCKDVSGSGNITFDSAAKTGTYYVNYKITNNAGIGETAKEHESKIDLTKPKVTKFQVGNQAGGYHTKKDVSVKLTAEFSDVGSGLDSYCISEEKSHKNCVWTKFTNINIKTIDQTKSLADGKYTYYFFVKDRVGNISDADTSASDSITVDTTKPVVEITELNTETLGNGWKPGFKVKVVCSDNLGTVTGSQEKTITGNSAVTVSGVCKDPAGNTISYSRTYKYNGCLTGANTCKYGCDKCYSECATGSNTCQAGYVNTTWNSCKTTRNTCVGGTVSQGATVRTSYGAKNRCTCYCHGAFSWQVSTTTSNCRSACAGADNFWGSCSCQPGYTESGNSCVKYSYSCPSGYTLSGTTCSKWDSCKTGSPNQCVGGWNQVWSNCATGSNTCVAGNIDCRCSNCYYGSNTCKAGFIK